ncbi:hypothetical protein, partial [Arthrobacter sp. Hiyo1]|uniref:hypothetical protein n=1 Tax=Arthrobacter sp. Hiyo1 TaxID=1588020 RepID=UPI001C0E9EE1
MAMPGTSFRDMLEDAKTSEPAEVDTSFLDEYRRTGVVPHRQAEEPAPEQDAAQPEVTAERLREAAEEGKPEIANEELLAQEPAADSSIGTTMRTGRMSRNLRAAAAAEVRGT